MTNEDVRTAIENGCMSKDDLRRAVDKHAEKTMGRIGEWLKAAFFWILVISFLLPSLGLTAVLFAYAYSLLK